MSCYEWEQGEIVIPKGQWASFRTELLRKWNTTQTANWELAKDAYKAAKEAGKGKRGKNRKAAILNSLANSAGGSLSQWGEFEAPQRRVGYWGAMEEDTGASLKWDVIQKHCLTGWGNDATLVKTQPQKKDFDIKPLSKSAGISCGDAHVSLNNENNVVCWVVHENNRACDRAHEWWFAQELFKALKSIKWTRNSGGNIIGNDEYNREENWAGGGGNYVKQIWGASGNRR